MKTGEAEAQDLTALNQGYTANAETQFHVPIVRIEILNSGLDNPRITAEGSYTGYYKTPINLNSVMKYEVSSQSDKVVDAQAKWEARELVSAGIEVNASTGDVTFSKPGTYHVRPYVVNNKSEEVYPMNGTEYAWLTVIATEHNLTYYEAKAPTDCTGGDAYGWIGHYRCSDKDCRGRYFLDAAGTLEVSEDKVIINPSGHDWGEWEAVAGDPAKEQRVCRNYSNHVQTRDVYTVTFDVNKPEKATENPAPVPDAQRFTSDTRASVEAPKEPALAGYTFGGWFDEDGNPWLSTSAITSDMTLYAKWVVEPMFTVTYTLSYPSDTGYEPDTASYQAEVGQVVYNPTDELYAAAGTDALAAYDFRKDNDGNCWFMQENLTEPFNFTEAPKNLANTELRLYAQVVSRTYTVTYYDGQKKLGEQEVEYDTLIKQADADAKAPTKEGQTLSGWTTKGELWDFENDRVTGNLALYAAWSMEVTFDANGHGTAPAPEKDVKHGDKAQRPEAPTAEGYTFGGWCTDAACTVAYNFAAPVEGDLTLYAKWTPVKKDISGAKITLSETSYVYDYTAKEPAVVSVELDGEKLVQDRDYTIAYADNVEVGSPAMVAAPTVTVSGIGNYYGQASTTFEITSPAHAARLIMSDLDSTAWYMSRESGVGAFPSTQTLYLDHTMALGLMSGYKDDAGNLFAFGPNDELERCQAATIIYRLANPDSKDTTDPAQYASENTTGLSDVEAGKYYTAAVNWCVANGVITGYKDANGNPTAFKPHAPITREQLATIVGRYMDPQGTAGTDVTMFKDQGAINDWAKGGIAYCNKEGIMTGIGDTGNFGPQELSRRCQMSKVIAVVHRLGHEPGKAVATQAEPASSGALMAGSAVL